MNNSLPGSQLNRNASENSMDMNAPDDATQMLMITAIVQPFRLDAITLALHQLVGFGGMTVTECRGCGRGTMRHAEEEAANDPDPHAGARAQQRRRHDSDLTDFTSKLKLEIAVAGRPRADEVVATIVRVAHTGRPGDGKVFVWPIAHAIRIRTSDLDAAAL